jgi:hypothetical protein
MEKKISAMKKFDDIEFLSPHKKIRIFVCRFISYAWKATQPLIIGATVIYSINNNKGFRDVIDHNLP